MPSKRLAAKRKGSKVPRAAKRQAVGDEEEHELTKEEISTDEQVLPDEKGSSKETFEVDESASNETTKVDELASNETTKVDESASNETTKVDESASNETTKVDESSSNETDPVEKQPYFGRIVIDRELYQSTRPVQEPQVFDKQGWVDSLTPEERELLEYVPII